MRSPIRTSIIRGVIRSPIRVFETLPRRWDIGNNLDEFGYSASLAFGGLAPDDWFDNIATVAGVFVDNSSNSVILRASDDSAWGGLSNVVLRTEGFADIVLTFNGTFYVAIDIPYTDYIVSQLGNSLELRILPEATTAWQDSELWVDALDWID